MARPLAMLPFLFTACLLILSSTASARRSPPHSSSSSAEGDQVASGEIQPTNEHLPRFSNNKQYTFKYDSQLATSLSGAEQFAISRVRATIRVQFVPAGNGEGQSATVSCEEVQLAMAQEPATLEPDLMKPFNQLERKPISERMQQTVQLPFQARFTRTGKVTDLQFGADDQPWSENLKRSMVNLLQVKGQPERVEGDAVELESGEQQQRRQRTKGQGAAMKSFSRMETTIEGECEMAYTVVENEGKTSSSLNVTKAVNFENCRRRPELRYNFHRYSELYGGAQQGPVGGKRAVDVSTVYETEVGEPRLNTDTFNEARVVLRAQGVSRLSYNLVDGDHTAMVTCAITRLVLTDIQRKGASSQAAAPSKLKQAEPLIYSLKQDALREQFATEGKEQYLQAATSAYPATDNLPDIAVDCMRKLMESADVNAKRLDMREETVRELEHFIGLIRLANPRQLEQIRTKLGPLVQLNHENTYKNSRLLRDLYTDALTIACTLPSINAFAQMVKMKHVTPGKAAQSLQRLMHCRLTSDSQLNAVWSICDSAAAKENKPLRQSCLLTWGAMAGALCSSNVNVEQQRRGGGAKVSGGNGHSDSDKWALEQMKQQGVDWKKNMDDEQEGLCPQKKKQELVEKIFALYRSAADQETKITCLKTIGNMAIPASIQQLAAIVRSPSEQPMLRVHAIDALRHLSRQTPKAVQRLLLPVFQSKGQPTEVRLNAIYQLLHAHPEKAMMDQVCAQLQQETNENVKAFVQTALKEMVQSRSHFDQKTAAAFTAALQKLKMWSAYDESAEHRSPSRLDATFVFAKSTAGGEQDASGNNYQSPIAYAGTMLSMFGKSGLLPKEISVAFDSFVDGRLMADGAQYGVRQQDVEAALQSIAESIDAQSFDQVVTRGKRTAPNTPPAASYNPYYMLKSFVDKHRFFGHGEEGGAEAKRPQLVIYQRHHGLDTGFTLYEADDFKALLSKGKFDVGRLESSRNATDQLLHHYSAHVGLDAKVKLPTIAGIPLVFSQSTPALTACEGSSRLEFEPFGSEKVRGARWSVQVQPQAARSIVRTAEAFSPLFTAGVQTRYSSVMRLPLDFVARVSAETPGTAVAELEVRLPTKDTTLFHASSRPATFLRTWPAAAPATVFAERREKTLYIPELEETHKEVSVKHTCPMSGLTFELKGHWPKNCAKEPECILAGENVLEYRMLPSQSPLAAAKLRLKAGFRAEATDHPVDKQQLLKLFDTRPELFSDSSRQQVQSLKSFIEGFSPRMNTIQRARVAFEAIESPQERKVTMEMSTFCNAQEKSLCIVHTNFDCKMGAAEQRISGATKSSGPKEFAVRTIAHIANPLLQGVYPGGIRSEHMLAKLDVQITQSGQGAPAGNRPITIVASVYGKPSEVQVTRWEALHEGERYGEPGERRQRIPHLLETNDFVSIVEFQSPVPTKEFLKAGYYLVKSMPQTSVNVQESLENALWQAEDTGADSGSSGSGSGSGGGEHRTLYTRLIVDKCHVEHKQLWNLTLGDGPNSIGAKGDHIQLTNWDNSERDQMQRHIASSKRGKRAMSAFQSPLSIHRGSASLMHLFSEQSPDQYATCQLEQKKFVSSFDGANYVVPMQDCYTILAKDCSSGSSPAFVVMAKKATGDSLAVKVLLGQKKFELAKANGQLVVRKDGVELRNEDLQENGIRIFGSGSVYILHCEQAGVEVEFDGRNVMVRIASKYVNRQCGVCGHYNLDNEDELTIVVGGGTDGQQQQKQKVESLRHFHAHYVQEQSDEQCDAKAVAKKIKEGKQQSGVADESDAYAFFQPKRANSKKFHQAGGLRAGGVRSQGQQQLSAEQKSFEIPSAKDQKTLSHSIGGQNVWEDDDFFSGGGDAKSSAQKEKKSWESWESSSKEESAHGDAGYGSGGDDQHQQQGHGQKGSIAPRSATRVLETRGSVCFSMKAVNECPAEESRPAGGQRQMKKTISFVCLPRRSVEAKRLLAQKRDGRAVVRFPQGDEWKREAESMRKTVSVPKACEKH